MKLRSVLLATAMVAAPAVAMAQPVNGLYVGLGAGYNYLQQLDLKFDTRVPLPASSAKLSGDGGFVGSGSIGWGFGNGFRVEVQGDYRQDNQKISNSTFFQGGDGDTESYGGYLNGLYDFDVGYPFFFPYVGVGAGYRWTELNNAVLYAPGTGLNV